LLDLDKYMPVQCHYQSNPSQEDHAEMSNTMVVSL